MDGTRVLAIKSIKSCERVLSPFLYNIYFVFCFFFYSENFHRGCNIFPLIFLSIYFSLFLPLFFFLPVVFLCTRTPVSRGKDLSTVGVTVIVGPHRLLLLLLVHLGFFFFFFSKCNLPKDDEAGERERKYTFTVSINVKRPGDHSKTVKRVKRKRTTSRGLHKPMHTINTLRSVCV